MCFMNFVSKNLVLSLIRDAHENVKVVMHSCKLKWF